MAIFNSYVTNYQSVTVGGFTVFNKLPRSKNLNKSYFRLGVDLTPTGFTDDLKSLVVCLG